jgi:hypothetical protein
VSEAVEQAWPEGGHVAWGPGEIVPSQCAVCRHRVRGFAACKAFPSQIPGEIEGNQVDHRRPFDGDQGVRFEPKPGLTAADLAPLYAVLDELDDEDDAGSSPMSITTGSR